MINNKNEKSAPIRTRVLKTRTSFREAQQNISQELDNLQGIKDRLLKSKDNFDEDTFNKRLNYVDQQIELQVNDLKYKRVQVQILDDILESNDSDEVIYEKLKGVFE